MNKIDEIALRVWSDVAKSSSVGQSVAIKFAHALLAELSKDAEPVGYRYIDHNGHLCFNEMKFGDIAEPVYSHPAMLDQSKIEQRVAEAYEQGQQSCSQFDIWMQNPYTKVLENSDKESYEQGKRDTVPEGWVMVPVEPTEAMLGAISWELVNYCRKEQIYKAAIAAAPAMPKSDMKQEK